MHEYDTCSCFFNGMITATVAILVITVVIGCMKSFWKNFQSQKL